MRKTILVVGAILLLFTFAAPLILPGNTLAETLEEAISKAPQGTEPGQISPDAPKGYLGIPGAPKLNPIIRAAVGHLGGMDLFHRRGLRGHYGRRGPHDHLWTG